MSADISQCWLLAACYRSGYLTLAVFAGNELKEVRVKRLRDQRTKTTAMQSLIRKFALDYAVDGVVVEPSSTVEAIVHALGLSALPLTLKDAKRRLLPEHKEQTHRALYDLLVKPSSPYRRLVNVYPRDGALITQQWRLVSLLSVALGLAALQKSTLLPTGTVTSSTPNFNPYAHQTFSSATNSTHQNRKTTLHPQ